MSGAWPDLLLAALLAALLAWLFLPRLSRLARPAAALGPAGRAGEKGWRQRVAARLSGYFPTVARQAGYDPEALRWFFHAGRLLFALLLPSLLLEAWSPWGLGPAPGWLLLPALIGCVLPDLWLLGVRRTRRRQVTIALSFFADLLVAFLHSGLSLEQAFRRAGREGFAPTHPLAREIALVGRELDAGGDPADAFRALADRTGVPELRGIAAALNLGMRLGAPVRTTLKAQADLLWTRRRERALKQINAASMKVMFPVMLAGFPLFFVLTFFPAILQLVEELRFVFG